jgi:hypothetical protein
MHPVLNLPQAHLKIKENQIWDILRRDYVRLTPEEWVRQNFIHYLINHLHYPTGRMVSEYQVKYNGMNKRCDIAVFDTLAKTEMIVECKAPHISINEDTFYQIAKYTHSLGAKYLILTNGLEHYCAFIDTSNNQLTYLTEIPDYKALKD